VNIASTGGLRAGGSSIAYSASKAGLIHLTRCLAVALAPEILVNCVAPGLVEGTRMAHNLSPTAVELLKQRAVLHRDASIDDIANQVVAYCRYDTVTGQVIAVDSGLTLG
jgi:3-oxoacyl-[acyl-carrier protein] reductase